MQAEGSQVGAAYAKALIEVAQDSNSLEDTHKDVDALMSLLKENPKLASELEIQGRGSTTGVVHNTRAQPHAVGWGAVTAEHSMLPPSGRQTHLLASSGNVEEQGWQ